MLALSDPERNTAPFKKRLPATLSVTNAENKLNIQVCT